MIKAFGKSDGGRVQRLEDIAALLLINYLAQQDQDGKTPQSMGENAFVGDHASQDFLGSMVDVLRADLKTGRLTRGQRGSKEFSFIKEEVRRLKDNLERVDQYLSYVSMGMDSANIERFRYIPVRVYLANDDVSQFSVMQNELRQVLDSINLSESSGGGLERGSWFRRAVFNARGMWGSREGQKLRSAGQKRLENLIWDRDQSEIDNTNVESIAKIIAIADKYSSVGIQIGRLLVVKTQDGHIFARTMSIHELEYVENHQELLKNPENLLQALPRFTPIEIARSGNNNSEEEIVILNQDAKRGNE